MILINLLPDQHRLKTRAPFKFMAVVSASVAINASLAAYLAWTAFGVAAEVNAELRVLADNKAGLDPQVAYHEALESESKLFETREVTLEELATARVSWTQQVDLLVDVINAGGDGEYLVWLDGLSVDQKENPRAGVFGMMSAQAHSGTANFAHVANFLEDIEGSDLNRMFSKPAPPTGSASMTDEGLMPSEIWNFPLEMGLKAPKERVQQ